MTDPPPPYDAAPATPVAAAAAPDSTAPVTVARAARAAAGRARRRGPGSWAPSSSPAVVAGRRRRLRRPGGLRGGPQRRHDARRPSALPIAGRPRARPASRGRSATGSIADIAATHPALRGVDPRRGRRRVRQRLRLRHPAQRLHPHQQPRGRPRGRRRNADRRLQRRRRVPTARSWARMRPTTSRSSRSIVAACPPSRWATRPASGWATSPSRSAHRWASTARSRRASSARSTGPSPRGEEARRRRTSTPSRPTPPSTRATPGGPLLDAPGSVIGVNSAIASLAIGGEAGNIGLGFAIPSNSATRIADELIATGSSRTPLMGVQLDMAYAGAGARVETVTAGQRRPTTAGLRAGDVIVQRRRPQHRRRHRAGRGDPQLRAGGDRSTVAYDARRPGAHDRARPRRRQQRWQAAGMFDIGIGEIIIIGGDRPAGVRSRAAAAGRGGRREVAQADPRRWPPAPARTSPTRPASTSARPSTRSSPCRSSIRAGWRAAC